MKKIKSIILTATIIAITTGLLISCSENNSEPEPEKIVCITIAPFRLWFYDDIVLEDAILNIINTSRTAS